MADQILLPRQLDANGNPESGAKAYIYETGTVTPVTVYTDTGLTVPHASPIVADSEGYFAQAFYSGSPAVKLVIDSAADVTLLTHDPAVKTALSVAAASGVSFTPTTEIPETDVQAAIARPIETDRVAYGSKTGDDTKFVTGTEGADGNVAVWDAGNLVGSGIGAGNWLPIVAKTPFSISGSHDGANNAAVLSDSNASWVAGDLVGLRLFNETDTSVGTITANTATTATATLISGVENDWDSGDVYSIRSFDIKFDEFDPSKYESYLFHVSNLEIDEDDRWLVLQSSSDGGATYDGGSDYSYVLQTIDNPGTPTQSLSGLESNTYIALVVGVGSGAGEDGATLEVKLISPHLSKETHVVWSGAATSSDGREMFLSGAGKRKASIEINGLRFLSTSAATFTAGKITMYGLLKP